MGCPASAVRPPQSKVRSGAHEAGSSKTLLLMSDKLNPFYRVPANHLCTMHVNITLPGSKQDTTNDLMGQPIRLEMCASDANIKMLIFEFDGQGLPA